MNIYAISDLEGLYPQQVLPMYEEIKKEKENKKIIICGDVIDSTIAGKGIYQEERFRMLKSNNIKTIYDIVTNPNIFLTFGNRDLNKMKVGPLSELKSISDASDNLINQFNNGELNLDFSTYQSFSKLRLDWVQKMSNWYPFWGGAISDKICYWRDDNQPEKGGFFERRFQKIFGADTSIGTMSAGYLLETIPLELGLYKKENDDYNAFVVLAVFKSMLKKKDFNDKEQQLYKFFYSDDGKVKKPIEDKKINQSYFKGLLYTLFTSDKNDMIIKKCKCDIDSTIYGVKLKCSCPDESHMYLFSHGGVSSDIIKGNTLDELSKLLEDGKTTVLREKLTDANKFGGYYAKLENSNKTNKVIIEKITIFNKKIKETIKAIFDEDYTKIFKPSNNMLLLLIASATFDCKSFYTKTFDKTLGIDEKKSKAETECAGLDILNISSEFTSTMAGIKRLRNKDKIFFNNSKLYNIFGHNPNGFLPAIDLFENNSQSKTYLINLDTSNTFLSSDANIYDKENSYSYIKIDKDNIEINTNIYIKTTEAQQLKLGTSDDLFTDIKVPISKDTPEIENSKNAKIIAFMEENKKLFITRPDIEKDYFETVIEIKNNINDDMDKNLRKIKDNENIFYHGIINKETKNFIIFTYHRTFGPPFPRCLFIINEDHFNKGQTGGNYFKKYLKYKQKYTELKVQLGGK
jgi:hypothetical protein